MNKKYTMHGWLTMDMDCSVVFWPDHQSEPFTTEDHDFWRTSSEHEGIDIMPHFGSVKCKSWKREKKKATLVVSVDE